MTCTCADMPVAAAVILIPLSVVIYTVAGGLKATFTSSYLHTVRPCPRPLSSHTTRPSCGNFSWYLCPAVEGLIPEARLCPSCQCLDGLVDSLLHSLAVPPWEIKTSIL